MIITRTPVRVSFAGGGTDLPSFYVKHGGEVLNTSINKYFYTVVTGREDRKIQLISSDFRVLEYYDRLDRVRPEQEELSIPLAAIKHLAPSVGMNLFLASEIPPGTGLGSSATVCVNVLMALSAYLKRNMTKHEMAERAFRVSTESLNRPVGKQDEYAATFGGLNHISFSEDGVDLEPVDVEDSILSELQNRLLLFFLGSSRQSVDILSQQDRASLEGEREVIKALHGARDLVQLMKAALVSGDLHTFGQLLHKGWMYKKRFAEKVSNEQIDWLYDLAVSSGAVGGKITGAGGGGFLLLYVPRAQQDRVRTALTAEGLKEMHCEFDFHGSRLLYDDPFFDSSQRGEWLWKFVKLS